MSKERESTFGEFKYPTLAVNLFCPKCNVPDVFYEPNEEGDYMRFQFTCHSCTHGWVSERDLKAEKKAAEREAKKK
jgi:hypothetical protein